MNIEEFEQKVRQCIYYTNQVINQVGDEYSCSIGGMRVIYQAKYSDIEWIIITPFTSAYGDTLEECVQTIANAEGVRYFPGIVPTKQQFITTVESYIGSSNVDYSLLNKHGEAHYSASYTSEGMTNTITYSLHEYRHPWFIYRLHNQSGLGMTGSGDSLEEAVNESNR